MAWRKTREEAEQVAADCAKWGKIEILEVGNEYAVMEARICERCGQTYHTHAIAEHDWKDLCSECEPIAKAEYAAKVAEEAKQRKAGNEWGRFHNETLNR